jgi:hypothetical protein
MRIYPWKGFIYFILFTESQLLSLFDLKIFFLIILYYTLEYLYP